MRPRLEVCDVSPAFVFCNLHTSIFHRCDPGQGQQMGPQVRMYQLDAAHRLPAVPWQVVQVRRMLPDKVQVELAVPTILPGKELREPILIHLGPS